MAPSAFREVRAGGLLSNNLNNTKGGFAAALETQPSKNARFAPYQPSFSLAFVDVKNDSLGIDDLREGPGETRTHDL